MIRRNVYNQRDSGEGEGGKNFKYFMIRIFLCIKRYCSEEARVCVRRSLSIWYEFYCLLRL